MHTITRTDIDMSSWMDRHIAQRNRMSRTWKSPITYVIDPAGCGCTDCIVGDSIPQDLIDSDLQLDIAISKQLFPSTVLDRTV